MDKEHDQAAKAQLIAGCNKGIPAYGAVLAELPRGAEQMMPSPKSW